MTKTTKEIHKFIEEMGSAEVHYAFGYIKGYHNIKPDFDQLRKELEQNIQSIAEEYESGQCKDLDEGLIKLKILNDSTLDKFSQSKDKGDE